MKIKEGFMIREVAGSYVVVPVGSTALDFNGMITLNETGAFLWKKMEQDCTKEQLLEALLEEYEVKEEQAIKGIEKFLTIIEENHFAEN